MSGELSGLQFYLSTAHTCGYLDGQQATEVWADPDYPMSSALYSQLAQHGFRRSGDRVYRPHCGQCNACIPVRLDCNAFTPTRSQRRCWSRNRDLQLTITTTPTEDYSPLYARYIRTRHSGGAMDTPEATQPLDFLASHWCRTHFYEFRLDSELIAVSAVDVLADGLSAVYTFFDPEQYARGPGVYAVLTMIEQVRKAQLSRLYLGYWIEECRKMNYKHHYQPLQYYLMGSWHTDLLTENSHC